MSAGVNSRDRTSNNRTLKYKNNLKAEACRHRLPIMFHKRENADTLLCIFLSTGVPVH